MAWSATGLHVSVEDFSSMFYRHTNSNTTNFFATNPSYAVCQLIQPMFDILIEFYFMFFFRSTYSFFLTFGNSKTLEPEQSNRHFQIHLIERLQLINYKLKPANIKDIEVTFLVHKIPCRMPPRCFDCDGIYSPPANEIAGR